MAARIVDFNLRQFLRYFASKPRNARNARCDLLPPNPVIWDLYPSERQRALASAEDYFLRAFGAVPETHIVKEPIPQPLGAMRLELRGAGQRMVLWMLPDGQFLRFPPKRG